MKRGCERNLISLASSIMKIFIVPVTSSIHMYETPPTTKKRSKTILCKKKTHYALLFALVTSKDKELRLREAVSNL